MVDQPASSLRLDDFLPYRLSVLSNRVSTAIADIYQARFGLTIPQWRVIAVLGESGGLSAGEVAARTAMDKVAVSRAVRGLLAKGRIERRVADQDRRRSVLDLSDQGRALYRRIAPAALAYERALLSRLSAEEQQALKIGLTALESAAGGARGNDRGM